MRIQIFIIYLSCCFSFSQHNFNLENSLLKWQKVFHKTTNYSEIKEQLLSENFVINKDNDIINFEKSFTTNELKNHGYKRSTFPTYFNDGTIFGFIAFKENRYRVTITQIQFINILNPDIINNISDYIRNEKKLNSKSNLKVLNTLESYFTKSFTLNDKKDNW